MNFLTNENSSEGPTGKLCPSEEPKEAKQAYPRRDGRQRPRWKDGSHAKVENTDAEQSRCDGPVIEPNPANEPLETVQSLLELTYEFNVSTRDRPARTEADARIEDSGANGELRLALQPYGRKYKRGFGVVTG